MSDRITLNAEPRTDLGKGASRRLRRSGLVPAVIYGANSDPASLTLQHKQIIHELENESIYTQIIDLKIDKQTEEVILRDLQRHPFKQMILHADFMRIDKKKPIHVTVPVHTLNADICHGVKIEGGMLTHLTTEIEIVCLPKNLPEYLEIDATELHLGDSLHLTDIVMPEGVEIVALTYGDDHDTGVIAVTKTREIKDEDEDEVSETEADADSDEGEEEKQAEE